MRFGSLAPVYAVFNQFFGIVPGAARISHENRQELARKNHAGQKAAERFFLEQNTDQHRREDRKKSGTDQFFLSRFRTNGNDAGIIRQFGAFPNRLVTELNAHFMHNQKGRTADRANRQRAEQKRNRAADQKSDKYIVIGNRKRGRDLRERLMCQVTDVGDVSVEKRDGRDHRRSDRHALSNRLGRIADRIQVRKNLARIFIKTCHFTDPVGVISHRAEHVHGDVVAGQGQQADARHSHAVGHMRRTHPLINRRGNKN